MILEYLRPKISILLKTNFGNHNNQHFIDFLINDVIMNDTQKEMRADIIIKELSVKKERGVPQYWNTFLSQSNCRIRY